MKAKNHHTVETYTGRLFDIKRPDASEVCIKDIAHALANICRYTGHCRRFYSVAEHCVLGARLVPRKYRLAFLLHDAVEAYIGDTSRPFKTLLPEYRQYERAIQKVIYRALYGRLMTERERRAVRTADNQMLLKEAKLLMSSRGREWKERWTGNIRVAGVRLQMMAPRKAKKAYLDCFKKYSARAV
jgi:5'-deoxynucleotidase YfbR-like HD superfamily hydrolase